MYYKLFFLIFTLNIISLEVESEVCVASLKLLMFPIYILRHNRIKEDYLGYILSRSRNVEFWIKNFRVYINTFFLRNQMFVFLFRDYCARKPQKQLKSKMAELSERTFQNQFGSNKEITQFGNQGDLREITYQ